MSTKHFIIIIVIIFICSISLLYMSSEKKEEEKEVQVFQNLKKNIKGKVYFIRELNGEKVIYNMTVEKHGERLKINFDSYSFYSAEPQLHNQIGKTLKNAWLLDFGSKYYLYTPEIYDKIVEYKPGSTLFRYRSLPIVLLFYPLRFIENAENIQIKKDKVYMNGKKVEAELLSYELRPPFVPSHFHLKTWIVEGVAVKSEMKSEDVKMVSGFTEYGFDLRENFTLPDIMVVRR